MSRVLVLMSVTLAAALLCGCQPPQSRMAPGSGEALLTGGHGVHLFGPEPLALGQEDLGYFAMLDRRQPQPSLFDFRTQYVRTWIWDIEDNRRPGLSSHRRRVWSEDVLLSFR